MLTFLKKIRNDKAKVAYCILIVLSLVCFEEITDDVIYDPSEGDLETPHFDQSVLSFLKTLHHPSLIQSMTDFTALGSSSVLTLFVVVIGIMLIYLKHKRLLIYLSLAAAGASVLPPLLKHVFNRSRPTTFEHLVNVSSSSYPSGHALASTTLFLAFAFIGTQIAKSKINDILFYIGAVVVISLVSFSRMYLGVHYPTDVFAGVSLGVAWHALISCVYIHRQRKI